MDIFRTLVAWGLFLLMAIIAGFFWHQSAERGNHIGELSATVAQLEHHINELTKSITSLEAQVEQAGRTIASLRSSMEESGVVDEATPDNEANTSGLTLGDMLDTLMSGDALESDAVATGMNMMKNMLEGPQGEQMLEMGTRMAMDMQFRDFFDMIPEESVDAVREILGDYMIHVARIGVNIMDTPDDSAMQSATETMESAHETMLVALRGVLGDDGVALYEQYETELPGRMMDQALEMQLGMFARELSEETRDLVRLTMVEELLDSQPPNMTTVPTPSQMKDSMVMQDEAYDRALDRLALDLSEEEFSVVERFVQQQQQMMNTFGSMMGLKDDEQ